MKLDVVHRTHFVYEGPVVNSLNEIRLRPITDDNQSCLEYQLQITPTSPTRHFHDFYGNFVQYFEINDPHRSMTVEGRSTVETHLSNPFEFTHTITLQDVEDAIVVEELHDYVIDSPQIPLTPELWKKALDLKPETDDLWNLILQFKSYIHKNFTYLSGSTDVATTATQALELHCGVCQDFSHVLIGMLRSLRIPARYVCGYMYESSNMQLAGDGRRQSASHAWCEVFLPGVGWRGIDPTNGMVVNDHYIKLAIGRDYSDTCPLKGTYRGPHTQTMNVEVLIKEIAASN